MSKKIIYLLSLLMALSLVFASCKKNSVTDALGGGDQPPKEENNDGGSQDNGLYPDSDSMPTDDVIRRNTIFNGTLNGNYQRNPVIVAGRDGAVFIFFEIRYERAGAANDVGVDGIGKVDIGYVVSANAGKDKFGNSTIKYVGTQASDALNSHGAPVVYYIQGDNDYKTDKIVIVATSGEGIGRTTKDSSQKTSKIDYIVGTFDSNTEISWKTWTEVTIAEGLETKIKQISTGVSDKYFSQFGTHAERGFIDSNDKLILPVIMAYQGNNSNEASVYELMGAYILEGTVNPNNSTVSWEAAKNNPEKTGYNGTGTSRYGDRLGQWKESHIAPNANGDSYDILVIPSPQGRSGNNNLGIHQNSKVSAMSQSLPASEGSFGYLRTTKWFGKNNYNMTDVSGSSGNPSTMVLYSHVQSETTKLTLHLLEQNRNKVGSIELGATGKSSSIDMLPDGTIVIAAENTKDGDGYFMQFERRTQAKIVELAK